MTECLEAAVQAKDVPMLDKTQVIKILTDGGTVCGLLCLNTAAQDEMCIRDRHGNAQRLFHV